MGTPMNDSRLTSETGRTRIFSDHIFLFSRSADLFNNPFHSGLRRNETSGVGHRNVYARVVYKDGTNRTV
jgi:hypothetical protein